MFRFSISPSMGRRGFATGVAAMMLSIAACADGATAPQTAAARRVDRPSEVLQIAAFVTVHVVDATLKMVTETPTIRFRSSQPNDSISVKDNSAKDLDPAIGVLKVAMPMASGYDACALFGTPHFARDTVGGLPNCNSTAGGATSINVGKIYMRQKPMVTLNLRDMFGNTITGAKFQFVWPQGWLWQVYDGQGGVDEAPAADGKLVLTLPGPGKFTFCETKPPYKYDLGTSQCGVINADWAGIYSFTLKHEQLTY